MRERAKRLMVDAVWTAVVALMFWMLFESVCYSQLTYQPGVGWQRAGSYNSGST